MASREPDADELLPGPPGIELFTGRMDTRLEEIMVQPASCNLAALHQHPYSGPSSRRPALSVSTHPRNRHCRFSGKCGFTSLEMPNLTPIMPKYDLVATITDLPDAGEDLVDGGDLASHLSFLIALL